MTHGGTIEIKQLTSIREAVPSEFANELRDRAEETLNLIYEDYFADRKQFSEFQFDHLGHTSLVMKLVTFRFARQDVMERLRDHLRAHVEEIYGESDLMIHPIFYLRFSFPGIDYSELQARAFLDTQPHYDRAFGVDAFSFWLALADVDERSGGLCHFTAREIMEHFPLSERNRYNYDSYIDVASELDPMLERGTEAPAISAGDAFTFDSYTLHGATKSRGRKRISFDFRLAPVANVEASSDEARRIFEEFNASIDVSNANNLLSLGDFLGASRILTDVAQCEDNARLGRVAEALARKEPEPEILQDRALMIWQREYMWLKGPEAGREALGASPSG